MRVDSDDSDDSGTFKIPIGSSLRRQQKPNKSDLLFLSFSGNFKHEAYYTFDSISMYTIVKTLGFMYSSSH